MPDKNKKKLLHWNIPVHAHALPISWYRRADFLADGDAGMVFIEE